ncbi:MAG: sulfatase-like hydrolase/transferase [Fidelibacterota bacterium]|nr:MAG: sulfatase-like hydrolase/transferase [Candidatus Neomarinimicrobiota bacterium]
MTKNRYNRRDFIVTAAKAGVASAAVISAPGLLLGNRRDQPPNVIFIICDQMRGDALSCLGHSNARTPNLDRMAAGGTLFTNFFANSPVCIPSRVSMFSGLWPHQHGCLTNESGELIQSLGGSLLGYFHDRGYRVGWIGKNHTYAKERLQELDLSKIRAREPFRAYSKFVPPYWHSDTFWPDEQCHPYLNTTNAIEFIGSARAGEPFFLHLSYFDPHPPYMASSEYTAQYSSKDMQLPPYVPPEKLSERLAEHRRALHYDRIGDTDLTETMRYYYASIQWGVDSQVGRILAALEEKELAGNTIVLFASDHGDFMGEHRMVRKAMFLYDSLLHIPMIWYAPGRVQVGARVKNLAQGIDLFPTLVDLTGGRMDRKFPGRSLKPYLEGGAQQEYDFAVIASAAYSDLPLGYFDDPELAYNPDSDVPFHTRVQRLTWKAENRTAMARTNGWKLILSETRPPELYHMAGGWIERENVASKREHRKVLKSLEQKIRDVWSW